MHHTIAISTLLSGAFLLSVAAKRAHGTISCYTCASRNGSDTNCEDPFHPAHSTYSESCMVPKKGHKGKFPANFCLKVIGTSQESSGETLVVRACSLLTMDNQCGPFVFADQLLTGCILTCDYDGCNHGSGLKLSSLLFSVWYAWTLILKPFNDKGAWL